MCPASFATRLVDTTFSGTLKSVAPILSNRDRTMRFSLQSILLSFVVVWSSMAAFGMMGILLGLFLVALTTCIRKRIANRAVYYVLTFWGVAVLIWAGLPDRPPSSRSQQRTFCCRMMRQVAQVLSAYHDEHGSFPPACVADADGKPMHSWRVLILPHLEYGSVYQAYDFDEPWDGPNNRKLAGEIPVPFQCVSSQSRSDNCTNYVAVVGPKGVWPGATSGSRTMSGDQTILLVEVANSDIHWMEPRDLSYDVRCSDGGVTQ